MSLLLPVAMLVTFSLSLQESKADNPQYLEASDISIEQGKYLISLVYDRKIVIAVWGGTFDFQQQLYNAALDLRDKNIQVAFIRLKDNDEDPDTSLVALYAAKDHRYVARWNVNDKDKVRAFISPAAEYLHNWHYTSIKPRVQAHQGYFLFQGSIIKEDIMDRVIKEKLNQIEN